MDTVTVEVTVLEEVADLMIIMEEEVTTAMEEEADRILEVATEEIAIVEAD